MTASAGRCGRWRRQAVAMLILFAGLVPARAALAQEGPGVQAGVSADPSQFYVGAHYVTAPIVQNVWFRPNLEAGFGHGLMLLAFNLEFIDRVPLKHTPWRLYFGGGPALDIRRSHGSTDSGGGLNVLVGLVHPNGLFTEVKIGLVDSPSFKFGIGYTFGR